MAKSELLPDFRKPRFNGRGLMRSRIFVGAFLLVSTFSAGVLATSAAGKHWAVVNFPDPVQVQKEIVMGPVLIVHDDAKMAKGEPCTTFYRFDPKAGRGAEIVSFHCIPAARAVVDTTTFTVAGQATNCKRLIEYQIAGESEAHGVPAR
jgi:hypothetical protein